MHRGYVKLWRKTLDSGILKNPHLLQFWVYCLIKATHKPTKVRIGFQEVSLEPGQFVFGRKKASEDLEMSERSIRTCLSSLKATSNVTIKTTNKFSVISVIKWHTYQNQEKHTDQQNGQQAVTPPTNNRPTTDHIQEVLPQVEVTTLPGITPGGGKVKPKKPTDPDLSELIKYFCEKYEQVIGAPYIFNGPKDSSILKGLKRTFDKDQVKNIIDLFFESDDSFIRNAGHTIGILSTKAQWIVEREMTK